MSNILDLVLMLGLKRNGIYYRGKCPLCQSPNSLSLWEFGGEVKCCCFYSCSRVELRKMLSLREDFSISEGREPEIKRVADKDKNKEKSMLRALEIWRASTSITNTPAEAYLRSRGLEHLIESAALRFSPKCRHPHSPGYYPAMVAMVSNINGEAIAIHRTFLDEHGQKANLDITKASKGSISGGMICLDPFAPEMVIGEGIETSASAGIIYGLPALAAISAGNLESSIQLPPTVHSVIIAADADEVGQKSAQAALARWVAEGRKVRIYSPNMQGKDFNDILIGRRGRSNG